MSNRRPFIFLADDDDLDSSLTSRAVRRALPDAEIKAVHDGVAALAELHALAEIGRQPDLILLDYKMPRKGCADILDELLTSGITARVPFVLFSSSVSPSDVTEAIAKGIREYVEKPTDPDHYDLAVRDVCCRYAQKLPIA